MAKVSVDPRGIFIQADAFEIVYEKALAEIEQNRNLAYRYPLVVNSSFAMELYLKCLLTIEKTPPPRDKTGHDVRALFGLLKPATQQQIKDRYAALLDEDKKAIQTHNWLVNGGNAKPGTGIEQILEQSKNAFQQYRYIFEASTTNGYAGYLLVHVRAAIRDVILSLHPEWAESPRGVALQLHTILRLSPEFEQRVSALNKDFIYTIQPLTCPNCLITTMLKYDVRPDEDVVEFTEGKKTINWPDDNIFHCPNCPAEVHISALRDYLEAEGYHKIA